ncbi:MAG: DNA-directed RNA polymerase subunit omega [Selenomonadaceae bacterium]|nr:DNA-directed RNA polymerase subunit omega [Selenomonadaceae bacterium]MBQ3971433.1 DNA-directed RNA polymerase subunit omega [Selenomonadaceae bacterium]
MKTSVVMSMVNPSTDALMTKVDSRYGLVVLAARRARQLMTGAEVKAKNQSTKNVTNALEEIVEGKITYEIVKDAREEVEDLEDEMYEEVAGPVDEVPQEAAEDRGTAETVETAETAEAETPDEAADEEAGQQE